MRTKILIIMLTILSFGLQAQEDDILPVASDTTITDSIILQDTLKTKSSFGQKIKKLPSKWSGFFNDENPKPKKALWMTFVLPGSGQAYNNKHWKIPIVYAGVGALSYAIAFNTRNYKRFKTAYIYRLDDDESTVEEDLTVDLSNEALQNVREGYRKSLEQSYMGLIGFYALVGVDAFVDAHLQSFDVSDELSWQLKPSLQNQNLSANPSAGMTLSLTFGYRKSNVLELNEAFEKIGK